MKLKNKLTGEINIVKVDEDYFNIHKDDGEFVCPVTLEELNAGWEDYYEEPKEIYFISNNGQIHEEDGHDRYREARKEIGNYFETREEAEKAVERLRALKRLKDKGFRFSKWFTRVEGGIQINMEYNKYDGIDLECRSDLDLLFGGEE